MNRKAFISRMRQVLQRRQGALMKSLASEIRQLNVGNDTGVGDSADAAVESDTEEISSQLAAAESRELQAISHALDRIRQGRYGHCETCNETIPLLRLEALPYATQCIHCQRETERAAGHQGARFHWPADFTMSDTDESGTPDINVAESLV